MKSVYAICAGLAIVTAGCVLPSPKGPSTTTRRQDPGLVGVWRYVDCNYKNTSVDGVLRITADGRVSFEGQVHRDYPTKAEELRVDAKWTDGEIRYSEGPSGMPVTSYYLVTGQSLYFSEAPIEMPEEKDRTILRDEQVFNTRTANWVYKLQRED